MIPYYSFYYADAPWIALMLVTALFAIIAQIAVKSTFAKYSSVTSARGLTAAQISRMILDRNGLSCVRIEHVSGNLSDHYDPRENVVRLSDTVYGSSSVAAIGVAAHECGHAVQYATGYSPIKLRSAMIPATRVSSAAAVPLIIIGLILGFTQLAYVGVILFAVATFFQLVTLPVEFNASRRALATLDEYGTLDKGELACARKVLTAAAMTYVAALATSLVQLLRFAAMVGGRNGRRR